jgi:hypothetical protein
MNKFEFKFEYILMDLGHKLQVVVEIECKDWYDKIKPTCM